MSESQAPEVKKKRIRRKPFAIQLEACLRESAEASKPGVDAGLRNLIQIRLQVLNQRLNREENGKLTKALKRVAELEAECGRLSKLLSQPVNSEAARLRRLVEAHTKGEHDVTI